MDLPFQRSGSRREEFYQSGWAREVQFHLNLPAKPETTEKAPALLAPNAFSPGFRG